MTDEQKARGSSTPRDGDAALRPEENDTPRRESGHTGAGQEATRAAPAGSHDDEHQSNYGGGGENGGATGGANGSTKK